MHRAIERGIDGSERVVALKRLLPFVTEDEEFVRAFVHEARLAALLQHDNIVRLYELGRVGGSYFVSMEYVPGRDLRVILRQAGRMSGPPPVDVTIALMTELLDALDHAHTRCGDDGNPLRLMHHDVSPSNLILGHTGHLKVIDFGIAKATDEYVMTNTRRIKGKLPYRAPEVVARRSFDGRSDLFSASVIAHELLTATPLFAARDNFQIIDRLQNMQAPPPSTANPRCPPELDEIVLRGLAKDPERRWPSAAEMRAALAELAVAQRRLTTSQAVCGWVEEAFDTTLPSPPGPERKSLSHDPPAESGRRSTTGSEADDVEDEIVDLAWGVIGSRSATPYVADDVPDVSTRVPLPPPGIFDLPAKPAHSRFPGSDSALGLAGSRTGDRTPNGGREPPVWMTSSKRQMVSPEMWAAGSSPPVGQAPGLLEEAVSAARRAEALAIAAMRKKRRRSMVQLAIASVMVTAAGAGVAWLLAGHRAGPSQVPPGDPPVTQSRAQVRGPETQTGPLSEPAPDPAQTGRPLPAPPTSPVSAQVAPAAVPGMAADRVSKPDDRANDRKGIAADAGTRRGRPAGDSADTRDPEAPARGARPPSGARVDPSQEGRGEKQEAFAGGADAGKREERASASTAAERPRTDRAAVRPVEPTSAGAAAENALEPLPVHIEPPAVEPARKSPASPRAPLLVPASRMQREGGNLRPIRFPPGEKPPATVAVKLCIDPSGNITSITVLSTVSPGVRKAVQRALSQLRYRPVVEAGEKVAACFASAFPIQID